MRAMPVAVLLGVAVLGGAWWGWRSGTSPVSAPAAPVAGAEDVAAAVPAGESQSPLQCGRAAATGPHPGMVWVPGRRFTMGAAMSYPEEAPAFDASVAGFWIDQTEVTNTQFAEFVAATGYRTLAERGIRVTAAEDSPTVQGSAVFRRGAAPAAIGQSLDWWQFVRGADWRHPEGPDSSLAGREHHPVVHVAWEDAVAYANWKGRVLPSEAQFELAAQGSMRRDAHGEWAANTWQGSFPSHDTAADGFAGTAPVACFAPAASGAYDLIGNVWEWTTSPYFPGHDAADLARFPGGFDPVQPDEREVAVLKGGSFLCAPDYCMRYRPEARIGQSRGLGTAHIGFRTVLEAPGP